MSSGIRTNRKLIWRLYHVLLAVVRTDEKLGFRLFRATVSRTDYREVECELLIPAAGRRAKSLVKSFHRQSEKNRGSVKNEDKLLLRSEIKVNYVGRQLSLSIEDAVVGVK